MLHAVKQKPRSYPRSSLNPDESSTLHESVESSELHESVSEYDEIPVLTEKSDKAKPLFYVYCTVCSDLRTGKLRVRCSSCKSGAFTVDSDPKSWNDVLKPNKISGHCEQDDCTVGCAFWLVLSFVEINFVTGFFIMFRMVFLVGPSSSLNARSMWVKERTILRYRWTSLEVTREIYRV